jgi:hypothetical protein
MEEEKRQGGGGGSGFDNEIDPAFLAQVTKKIAQYQQAATHEKEKLALTKAQATSELGGSYAVVEHAKREHNDQLVEGTLIAAENVEALPPLPTASH